VEPCCNIWERSGANNQLEEDGDHEYTPVSKRHHSKSLGACTSSKKCVPDESLFAWLANDNDIVLSLNQELTRKLVQNHVLDLKASKHMVLGATITDNRAIENIGDLKLHFSVAKPAKTVETHGDWVVAWRIVFKATHFIFPH
jgi:hypothetical protein